MKTKLFLIVCLTFLTFVHINAQTGQIKLQDIIAGDWIIEPRNSIVTMENPDGGNNKDTSSEIIKNTDKTIEFKNGSYKLESGKYGNYTIKGSSLILDGKKYQFGVFDENRFNLIRMISPDYMLTYMVIRKK